MGRFKLSCGEFKTGDLFGTLILVQAYLECQITAGRHVGLYYADKCNPEPCNNSNTPIFFIITKQGLHVNNFIRQDKALQARKSPYKRILF